MTWEGSSKPLAEMSTQYSYKVAMKLQSNFLEVLSKDMAIQAGFLSIGYKSTTDLQTSIIQCIQCINDLQ